MKIIQNDLEGMFATHTHHPNPAPWKIEELKISKTSVVWIRNKDSMWFRADECIIHNDE